jgi:hypothetical protein
MRLVGKTELCSQLREGSLAVSYSLEPHAHAHAVSVSRDRRARSLGEDPAEVMWRDCHGSRQIEEPNSRPRRQELACVLDGAPPSCDRRRTSRSDARRTSTLENPCEQDHRSLRELEGVARDRSAEKPPVLQVELSIREKRLARKPGIAAPQLRRRLGTEREDSARIASVVWMRNLLVVPGVLEVHDRRIQQCLHAVDPTPEAASSYEHDSAAGAWFR